MRARRRTQSVVAAACALALGACSPLAEYRGPVPAPGAISPFEKQKPPSERSVPSTWNATRWLVPGTTDVKHHHLGTLVLPEVAKDSVVILVYGDNRAGLRMQDHPREYDAILHMFDGGLSKLGSGLLYVVPFLIEAFVPTLDGPRDLVSAWGTRTPTGGHELAVLKAIRAHWPVDMAINTGDLVNDGRRGAQWERFVKRHEWMRTSAPYLATPGNHERMGDSFSRTNWNAAVAAPADSARYWYSVDLPDHLARLVFLDANVMTDPRGNFKDPDKLALAREQLAWADSALAPAFRFKFVVLHHPIVSSGHHLNDWGTEPKVDLAETRRARLLDICRRRDVTAVFAGHEHLYQRAYVRHADSTGFWHITTGGAGGPLYWISPRERRDALAHELPLGAYVVAGTGAGCTANHFCILTLPRARGHADSTAVLQVYRVRGNGSSVPLDRLDLSKAPEAR